MINTRKEVHISRIKRSVKLLNSILTDFLSIDALKEGEIKPLYEPIKLADFLKETVSEVESLKRGNQTLLVNYSGVETVISGRQLLRSILNNLLSNAFKFSHPEDQILLETEAGNKELIMRVTMAWVYHKKIKSMFLHDFFVRTTQLIYKALD